MNELCTRRGRENAGLQMRRLKIHHGMEGLSPVLFTACNDSVPQCPDCMI